VVTAVQVAPASLEVSVPIPAPIHEPSGCRSLRSQAIRTSDETSDTAMSQVFSSTPLRWLVRLCRLPQLASPPPA